MCGIPINQYLFKPSMRRIFKPKKTPVNLSLGGYGIYLICLQTVSLFMSLRQIYSEGYRNEVKVISHKICDNNFIQQMFRWVALNKETYIILTPQNRRG